MHAEPATGRPPLLADAFEQIGYQQESPSVRNSFLAAALELRSGIPTGAAPKSTGPDLIRALSHRPVPRLPGHPAGPREGRRAAVHRQPVTPDNGEKFVVELSNGTLDQPVGLPRRGPDLTMTINRSDLEAAMTGAAPLSEQVADGRAALDGDPAVLRVLADLLVHFELGFEILPGTGAGHLSPDLDDFAQEPPGDSAGG